LSSNELVSLRMITEEAGLELIGMSSVSIPSKYKRLLGRWLENGWHAGMEFMTRHRQIRENPEQILPNAKRVVVVAQPYDLRINEQMENRVASYACYEDYHRAVRKKCEKIVERLMECDLTMTRDDFRIAVDSAPILERAIASGTCFIKPGKGSAFFLAEIFCTKALAAVQEESPSGRKECGSCRRCVTHCPTGALDGNYNLDANKCLSYWTIEHRGVIPLEYWPHLPKYWYGCDVCQRVCPFNRIERDDSKDLVVRFKHQFEMFEVATMTQPTYERLFGGSPMTRAKREGLQRNALIVMKVTGDKKLSEAITILQQTTQSEMISNTIAQIYSTAGTHA